MLSFLHIADLHIGKKLHSYDLLEDQTYILKEIVEIVKERNVDAVFIAGDVFDRTVPTEAAFKVLDDFLFDLKSTGSEIFMIAGNHDPVQKISYLNRLVEESGLHVAGEYKGKLEKRSLSGANIYMLPFMRIQDGVRFYPDSDIKTLENAIRQTIVSSEIDGDKINILLAHQYVNGAEASGSEDIIIGGETPVSSSLFSQFDYVALGHIHRAQSVGSKSIRYSGSILKYSSSEKADKIAIFGTISDDRELTIEEIKLHPLRDLEIRKGNFKDVMSSSDSGNFIYVILEEESDVPDAVTSLSSKFKNFLFLEYDNTRTRAVKAKEYIAVSEKERTPEEYFNDLFSLMLGRSLSKEQEEILLLAIKEAKEDE